MIKQIKEKIEYSDGGILSKEIVRDKKIDVTLFCMAAGTEIGNHTSTKQGFVYVLEGKGVFVLEGKEIEMVAGKFIFMKEDAKHSLKAEGNVSFLLALC